MARKKRQQQAAAAASAAATASAMPEYSQDVVVNDSDDEEIDEDEAFNSDDERKYGSFFDNDDRKPSAKGDNGDDDDDDDDDESGEDYDSEDFDDDEEGDGGQYMLDLLDKLDGDDKNNKQSNSRDDHDPQKMVAHMKESAYASSVVPSAGLTMDALMSDLKDTKGFGALTKTMKKVSKSSSSNNNNKTTAAPLPKVQSDRLERQVHYSKASNNMTRDWMETVQENRKAETLDFRGTLQQAAANKITSNVMVDTFTPTTDFEKEIHAALQQAGQEDEEAILQAEEKAILKQSDDLGHTELTVEDLQQRRAQLAKMRALMFYHEQKRHHMNKIKSKKYRRIRKRQAARLKEAELEQQLQEGNNPNLEQELREKEHLEQIKERMTLAHKNTSKWAKRILKRSKKGGGVNIDVDTRRALSAQLKRGDDLRQKMSSRGGDNNEDSDNDSDSADHDNGQDLVETARKVLEDADIDDNDDDGGASSRPGLFKLAFMQRGIEKQKQQARQEARQLLQELQADRELEQQSDDDNDDDDGDSSNEPEPKKKAPVASRKEIKEIMKEGGELTTSRSASSTIAVSGKIQIDMGQDDDKEDDSSDESDDEEEKKPAASAAAISEHTSMLETAAVPEASSTSSPPLSKKSMTKKARVNQQQHQQQHGDQGNKDNEHDNPWLAAVEENVPNKKTTTAKKKKNKTMVDVERAVDLLEPHATSTTGSEPRTLESNKRKSSSTDLGDKDSDDDDDDDDVETKETPEDEDKKKITNLSQEELVRRAFSSSTAVQETEDDFAQEKAAVEEREDPLYKKKLAGQKAASCKGWGSWAGKGAAAPPPPSKKKRPLPKHLQPPSKKQKTTKDNDPDKRKRRDGGKAHLIIRERRVKRMADQFMLNQVPYPYACREDYERAMAGGIGAEWNVTSSVRDLTRPEICTRSGKIIEPLSQQAKKKFKNPSGAAKF